jgi:hypothetical protein
MSPGSSAPSVRAVVPGTADGPTSVERSLLSDGSMTLRVDRDAWADVEAWVPRIPVTPPGAAARATITVVVGEPSFVPPGEPPTLQLRSVAGWVERSGRVLLQDANGHLSAVVDPSARSAAVRLGGSSTVGERGLAIFAGLTLTAALVLGSLNRSLVHAGAVVAPAGGAWLLVGGTFSGKTTTCVSLMRDGWGYVSDDHVVLSKDAAGPRVEGWPRRFNLDDGYDAGSSSGRRSRVEPDSLGPGGWCREARLSGLLFPSVRPEHPTSLVPIGVAGAFGGLLRQSPWLLADPVSAPGLLKLIESAARLPAFELRLGKDSFRKGAVVSGLLQHEVDAVPSTGGPAIERA